VQTHYSGRTQIGKTLASLLEEETSAWSSQQTA
jgi:hypothetical protein